MLSCARADCTRGPTPTTLWRMSGATIPLLSVLLGAVLGGGTTLLTEQIRARNARHHDLLQVRREVELDALEQVRRLLRRFGDFLGENHDGTDDEADERQAATVDAFFVEVEALQSLALRVSVLANEELGRAIDAIEDRLRAFLVDSFEEGIIRGEPGHALLEQLLRELDRLARVVRADLRTAELEQRGRLRG